MGAVSYTHLDVYKRQDVHELPCGILYKVLEEGTGAATPRSNSVVSVHYKGTRSEEHTSELQSLREISYAVFCLKKNTGNC